jgi:hypothetical protein
MRKVVVTLVPLLFLGCSREPTAANALPAPNFGATVDHYLIQGFADWDYDVPLACTNETMHMSGHYDLYVKDLTLPNGRLQEQWINRLEPDWTFVGNTYGDVWDLQYSGYNQVGLVRVEGSALTFLAIHEHLSFKNPASGVVMKLTYRIYFVTNAAGEVTVDRYQVGDCRLLH